MLRFFRHLRQRLLSQDKFSKYLLYAIGEIVLVVIGILIALQINTWNEERLERKEEVEILKSVKNDLENTIGEFRFLNQIRNMVLYGTEGIYRMASRKQYGERELDSLLGLTFFRPTFNNKQGVIDLLFSTGKINLIRNDSIRGLLISWPGLVEDMTEEEVDAGKVFHDYYYAEVSKYVNLNHLMNKMYSISFFGTETAAGRYEEPPLESDYEGLLESRVFLNHLRTRALHFQTSNGEVEDLIRHAGRLIEMIDEEIKR